MNKIKIKRFNEAGIEEVLNLLNELKLSPSKALWSNNSGLPERVLTLISDNKLTDDLEVDLYIDTGKKFDTRYEFGRYLFSIFKDKRIEKDKGLLSWLSLLFFDQVCKKNGKSNKLKILSNYRYVPEIDNDWRFYRHLVLTPLLLWQRMGEQSYFLLANPLYESSDAVEQLVSRKDFIANQNMVSVANELYFDEQKGKRKTGAFTGSNPGNAIRLAKDLNAQLSLNYDLFITSKDRILSLLPDEFNDWR